MKLTDPAKLHPASWTGIRGSNLLLTAIAAAATLVAGCSDGSASSGGVASGSSAGTASTAPLGDNASTAASNVVIKNSDSGVALDGRFTQADGYLAQSAKSLLGSEQQQSAATFALPVPRSGHYEVFVWWPASAPAGSAAQAVVTHADGQTSRRLDQTRFGGQWNSLGIFGFDASKAASLRLGAVDGAPLLVDAVRLQYLGPDAPELAVRGDELPVGETNKQYFGRIEASGGSAPYTFRLDPAQLPPGLAFDAATGTLSGQPALPSQQLLEVEISDAAGRSKTAQLQLRIVQSSSAVPEAPRALESGRPSVSKDGPANGAPPNLSNLLSVIAALPEGEWSQVGLNSFSSAWTPPELRPMFGWGNPAPDRILVAWSSVAWDPNRGQLILYGGGHANYNGNDVYLWKGTTRRWERGSLPSEVVQDDLGYWRTVDGAGNAPVSAHTYDNAVFLPLLDRFLTFGGGDPSGSNFKTSDPGASSARITGPYLFDPSRADPNKVGGTTGSHVKRVSPHPEIIGGRMWQNRENWLNVPAPGYPYWSFVNGCTAYAQEGGKDVVYVRYGVNSLYRYTINDLNDTTRDTWEQIGVYWGGPGAKASCGVDPVGKTFVRVATNSTPFVYWNLSTPGNGNRDVSVIPADPGGQFSAYMAGGTRDIADCGLDFDPKRGQYALWCGDGRVWMLKPPATPSPNGWVITQQRTPLSAVPNGDVGTGILGKWKYIDNLDVFLGVQDIVQGNIWVYKPVGWQNPGGPAVNVPPTVAIGQPAAGATFASGAPITIAANAGDSDGSVVRVEFFNGSSKIGEAIAPPYRIVWIAAPVGTLALSALASDDRGAQTRSAEIAVTVAASPPPPPSSGATTVLLQRGQNGYTQSSDTYLSSYHTWLSFGAYTLMQDDSTSYSVFTRFAIFRSEGGPVPDGATIESATLSLYKYTAYDMIYSLHPLLRDWQESSATWMQARSGVSWSVAGAGGAGSDYAAAADATGQTDFNPGWISFDVTKSVQRMSNSTPTANYGWKLRGVSGNGNNNKRFYTSEYDGDMALRPKLEVRYR